jgi:L-methionine (R)-S-oxide reductase
MTKSRKRSGASAPTRSAAQPSPRRAADPAPDAVPERDPLAYEEIRRLLSTVFREAAGPLEAKESVCDILYQELDHYSWVGVYMVDGDELELTAWAGSEETEHTRIKIGEGICGLAAETGETEIVPDVSQNEQFIACFASTRSEIVVPILHDREVLGEIDVDSDLLDAFDEQDVRLLEWVAAKMVAFS